MKNVSIVDVLIENIITDQGLLEEAEVRIETAKNEKSIVVSRMKEHQKDISVVMKYADDSQRKKLEAIGFDFSESNKGMNEVASKVMDIIMKHKEHTMKNGDIFNEYVATFKKSTDAVNYTEFNIKCRSLFNSQRLMRTKGKDVKNTREDIISLNGSILEPKPDTSKDVDGDKK